jgi:hypothetical protein
VSGVSKEQIERAKAVPLLDYLLAHESGNWGRVGSAYYRRDPDHNSLEVSNNLWHWHSHGIGGNIIDYLIKINGYSFVDAVRRLAGDDYSVSHSYAAAKSRPIAPRARPPTAADTTERKPFALPPRNRDNERVIAYLESRGIDKPLISDAIKSGCLYETAPYHNVCFVGRDESGKARFAALRGAAGNFKRDADGSDKRFGFCLPPSERDCKAVVVFESPIDALSHKCLFPGVDAYRLSLGGTALSALMNFLERHKEIDSIAVCTDNDDAGNACAAKITELDGYQITRLTSPTGKDWNETLQTIRNEVMTLKDVRKDIIFRDIHYKEMFRIKDGDSIKITVAYDGEEVIRKCRWIDEAHTKIGSEYYHNDEFSSKAAKVGNRYEVAPNPKPRIDVLAAKYGEELQAVEIPMTEAAIRKLVGGKYETETLCYPNQTNQIKDRIVEIKGKAFGAVLRGKDGIAVCGLGGRDNDTLTALHPYNAQTCKRELSPATPPLRKASLLGELEATQKEVAEINAARATGEKPRKLAVAEI